MKAEVFHLVDVLQTQEAAMLQVEVACRDECVLDREQVLNVIRRAFGRESTANYVKRLDEEGRIFKSIVAIENDRVIGHIVYTLLPVEVDGKPVRAIGLSCLSVDPEKQSLGVGSRLIKHSLPLVAQAGMAAVIVLGHPRYYPRFGFSAEIAQKLKAPFSGKPSFMALELVPNALQGSSGSVEYAPVYLEE